MACLEFDCWSRSASDKAVVVLGELFASLRRLRDEDNDGHACTDNNEKDYESNYDNIVDDARNVIIIIIIMVMTTIKTIKIMSVIIVEI